MGLGPWKISDLNLVLKISYKMSKPKLSGKKCPDSCFFFERSSVIYHKMNLSSDDVDFMKYLRVGKGLLYSEALEIRTLKLIIEVRVLWETHEEKKRLKATCLFLFFYKYKCVYLQTWKEEEYIFCNNLKENIFFAFVYN